MFVGACFLQLKEDLLQLTSLMTRNEDLALKRNYN